MTFSTQPARTQPGNPDQAQTDATMTPPQQPETYLHARAHICPRLSSELDVVALPTAINESRMFTSYTLEHWGAVCAVEDAVLVVTELVSNAVKETGVTDALPPWSEFDEVGALNVCLLGLEASIVIEVWDTRPATTNDAKGGPDHSLVRSLARRWGSSPAPRGRVVWAEVLLNARAPSRLPQRHKPDPRKPSPYPRPPTPVERHVPTDIDLLRRVRDGLGGL